MLFTSKLSPVGFTLIIANLWLFVVAVSEKECDTSKCPGPLAYYEDLKCSPVYENPGDCCAIRYNCSHLNKRVADICYLNDYEYVIGQHLKEEDSNPCDINCICTTGYDGVAAFNCATVDCFNSVASGCYLKRSPLSCCAGEQVCPEDPADIPICNVDGKIYKDGEFFTASENPDATCICQPGYEGENVEPFCTIPKHAYCSPEMKNPSDIRAHCAPVYYSNQSPQTSCSVFSRCQNKNDTVIHQDNENSQVDSQKVPDDMICRFGNLTMDVGDELNQSTDYSSVCVKCVCEVPPTPTCQRLPDNECDVTKHTPF